jgi:glycosyltransferase involved in cell wall biosynthesis
MNANPDKVRVIYNRIKTEKFRTPFRRDIERKKLSLEKGVDPNTFILLYVGRICPEKDLSCTLEAIKILKDDGYDVCLLVVGDELPSPFVKPLKDALLLKMKRLGIENNVKITGFRPNNELPLYYRLADAFVFPSKVYGFGVALAEAQSAGLPILVSNALYPSDHGDIVSPENALVFDPVDSTDLAKKISLLIKNESLRERLSQLGLANSWKYGSARIEEQEAAYYSEIWGEARY